MVTETAPTVYSFPVVRSFLHFRLQSEW